MTDVAQIKDKKDRIFELDCLRVIAILAVIMIHVSVNLIIHNPQNSIEFVIGNFFDSISRFAVPFFVMLSGYFMLDENREMPISKLKNKVVKLLLILVFWSALYALIFNFNNFLNAFIYGHFHLWYLYLIIGLYLFVPVFRLFVKRQNMTYIYYTVLLGIIFIFLPKYLDLLFPPNNATKLFDNFGFYGGGYYVYFLIGWIIKNLKDKIVKYKKVLFILVILSLATTFCCTQFIHSHHFKAYKIFYHCIGLNVLTYSVSLFCVLYDEIKKHTPKFPPKLKQFITKCSALSFGVYLIHAGILIQFLHIFKNLNYGIIYVVVLFILTTISSFLTAYLISKIKYLNQLIKI